MEQYNHSGKKETLERGNAASFRAYSHKGCSNRNNSQYCFFCGRADKGLRFKTPEIYMKELQYLTNTHNAKYIFEIGDDFLQNAGWLKQIAELKESKYSDMDMHLKIFARANRITPQIIELLKRLDIDEVAIGFESGSDKILKQINKRATSKQNLRAAELLFSNDIDTIASFVLGLPGEDDESLYETYDLATQIVDLAQTHLNRLPQEIIANLIEINPGAPAYKLLVEKFTEKYKSEDILSIKETQDDYFKIVFGIQTPEEIKG